MINEKDNVYKTYEKIAKWFDEHRSRDLFEKPWLDKATESLPDKATILDLGCGMGEPMLPYFINKGYQVTGVDGSKNLISLAKKRFPRIKFLVSDIRGLILNETFDMILAWNSFFHLPQDDQRTMFTTFARHLKINGILLFTSGEVEGEVWGNNGGENLYHASLAPETYKAILAKHGFLLLDYKINDENCHGHSIWLAKLIKRVES